MGIIDTDRISILSAASETAVAGGGASICLPLPPLQSQVPTHPIKDCLQRPAENPRKLPAAEGAMESSSPSVPFPLLQAPVESTYRACTIPYRFPSDNPRKATPVEIQWIDLFLNSVPSFK
jgi:hypothetical protein